MIYRTYQLIISKWFYSFQISGWTLFQFEVYVILICIWGQSIKKPNFFSLLLYLQLNQTCLLQSTPIHSWYNSPNVFLQFWSASWNLRIFFFALKNPKVSAGFEPANLGTKGQHATSRPSKPLILHLTDIKVVKICTKTQVRLCTYLSIFNLNNSYLNFS